jgi:hypothetical protein
VFVPEIVLHVGRFCEVATRNGRFFGELVRLSAAVFLVRSNRPTAARPPIVEAADITQITDLDEPHL